MSNQEWNYFQCNKCYKMFPHLKVPRACICGNDLDCNSTRKKFFLSFKINEIIDKFFDQKQKEMNAHVEGFGKPGNRDIDQREKSVLLTLPIGYRKGLKELFAVEKKGDGGQDDN